MNGFLIVTTVNGNENVSEEFVCLDEALREADRRRLSSTKHLESYRQEIVENFGDRSRYALHDKTWEDTFSHDGPVNTRNYL